MTEPSNTPKQPIDLRQWIVFAVLMFSGCEHREPVSGLVTAKNHYKAYTHTVLIPMVLSTGKTTTITYIPVVMHEPERWVLTVEEYDEKGNPKPTDCINVKEEVYGQVKEGSWFKETPDKIDSRKAQKVAKDD